MMELSLERLCSSSAGLDLLGIAACPVVSEDLDTESEKANPKRPISDTVSRTRHMNQA
jgi:hypothetical protein